MKMKLVDVADWLCSYEKQAEAVELLKLKDEYIDIIKIKKLFNRWFYNGQEMFQKMQSKVYTYFPSKVF